MNTTLPNITNTAFVLLQEPDVLNFLTYLIYAYIHTAHYTHRHTIHIYTLYTYVHYTHMYTAKRIAIGKNQAQFNEITVLTYLN